jgi:hypothetical protein
LTNLFVDLIMVSSLKWVRRMVCFGFVCFGFVCFELVCFEMVCFGTVCFGFCNVIGGTNTIKHQRILGTSTEFVEGLSLDCNRLVAQYPYVVGYDDHGFDRIRA